MWKLWKRLFGWRYVFVKFGFGWKVRRIRTNAICEEYCKCYGVIVEKKYPSYHGWREL